MNCDECGHPMKFHNLQGCAIQQIQVGASCACTRVIDPHAFEVQPGDLFSPTPCDIEVMDQNPSTEATAQGEHHG